MLPKKKELQYIHVCMSCMYIKSTYIHDMCVHTHSFMYVCHVWMYVMYVCMYFFVVCIHSCTIYKLPGTIFSTKKYIHVHRLLRSKNCTCNVLLYITFFINYQITLRATLQTACNYHHHPRIQTTSHHPLSTPILLHPLQNSPYYTQWIPFLHTWFTPSALA